MDLKQAQVLITGGSEGIGKALAERFLKAGSRVLITGRNKEKLEDAAQQLKTLEYLTNDISRAEEREALAMHITKVMPGINILINNAGIQRRIGLAEDHAAWSERQAEIDTLLSAPVHLNHLIIPLMLERESLIVNVTSGGAYIPQVFAPVYSACKAALHHYTLVLRHALRHTSCRVVKLIPPAVQTALSGEGRAHGAPLKDFTDEVLKKLMESNALSIGYGPTSNLQVTISGQPLDKLFLESAARFPIALY